MVDVSLRIPVTSPISHHTSVDMQMNANIPISKVDPIPLQSASYDFLPSLSSDSSPSLSDSSVHDLTTVNPTTAPANTLATSNKNELSVAAICGIVVACVFVLIFILWLAYFFRRRQREKQGTMQRKGLPTFPPDFPIPVTSTSPPALPMIQQYLPMSHHGNAVLPNIKKSHPSSSPPTQPVAPVPMPPLTHPTNHGFEEEILDIPLDHPYECPNTPSPISFKEDEDSIQKSFDSSNYTGEQSSLFSISSGVQFA